MYIDKRSLIAGDPGEFMKLAWSLNPVKTKELIKLQAPNVEVTQQNVALIPNLDYFNFRRFLRQFQTSTDELFRAHQGGRLKTS